MPKLDYVTRGLLADVTPYLDHRPGPVESATRIPRLTLWSSTHSTSAAPAVFEPTFDAIVQGTKVLTIGANRFDMVAGSCTSSSFGLPYTHHLTQASPDRPYVGISLRLDIDRLTRVMLDMPAEEARWTCAVAAGDLGGDVGASFARLVGLLNTPDDIAVLAPLRESELYYRLLGSSMGPTLRQLVERDGRVRQIKVAADWLGANNSKPVTIADLAASAGMSVTSFHRHFKAVTGYSPLAFQRHMRLMEAKKLLGNGGTNVARVAYEVGYQSPSQFSREYKTMFGSPPMSDLHA